MKKIAVSSIMVFFLLKVVFALNFDGNMSITTSDYLKCNIKPTSRCFDDVNNSVLNGTVARTNPTVVNGSSVGNFDWTILAGASRYMMAKTQNIDYIVNTTAATATAVTVNWTGTDTGVCFDAYSDALPAQDAGKQVVYLDSGLSLSPLRLLSNDCNAGKYCLGSGGLGNRWTGVNSVCFIRIQNYSRTLIFVNNTQVNNGTDAYNFIRFNNAAAFYLAFTKFRIWNVTLYGLEGPKISYGSSDTTAPTLSNPICTSCINGTNYNGTNSTLDTTPTINVTCTDDSGCANVRIGNLSTYTYTTAGAARNCTQGNGNTWVCTLPTSDQLSNDNAYQPLYMWAIDTLGNSHTTYGATISVKWDTCLCQDQPFNMTIIRNCSITTDCNLGGGYMNISLSGLLNISNNAVIQGIDKIFIYPRQYPTYAYRLKLFMGSKLRIN